MSATASDSFRALGTSASLAVTETAAFDRARAIVDAELAAIDAAASRFRPDSELSRLNASAGRPARISPLFAAAIEAALRAAELTDGDVDPTVGRALRTIGYDRDFAEVRGGSATCLRVRARAASGWRVVQLDPSARVAQVPAGVELDLGATAKALAADRAAAAVHAALGGGVLVNLGGDLSTAGPPPAGGWTVHVTDDHAAGPAAPGQTITLSGGGLATSSTVARRWSTASGPRHHIVDPRRGDSASGAWRTASVAAASCLDANIAATAAIVRGEAAPAWLGNLALPSRLVRPGGETVTVAGWPRRGG